MYTFFQFFPQWKLSNIFGVGGRANKGTQKDLSERPGMIRLGFYSQYSFGLLLISPLLHLIMLTKLAAK